MDVVWNTLKVWDGQITQVDFNKLVDACQRITLNPGLNYNIKRSPAGTTLVTNGQAGSSLTCPFTVSLKKNPDDPTSLVCSISPGTVNSFVPTNAFDTFTVTSSDTYYVKATVDTDGATITSVEYNVDTSTPDPQTATASALPASVDVTLAVIQNGKAYRTIGCGSVSLTPVLAFTTDVEPPAEPGQSTTVPYYMWQQGID